ncbi:MULTISPECIES: hypothetical protein [Microbacterium]|uniref:hypothetical protein n=1 Tax=Microbacterium TaxID=33882 RepID=UPI0025E4106E|nr:MULTISPECIES: hypothetical protein [Microbacterium]
MFEAAHARQLIEALEKMNAELVQLGEQELELHHQVNPGGGPTPISPDAVAILGARMQIATLSRAVHTIGTTLVEILVDRAEEENLGLK